MKQKGVAAVSTLAEQLNAELGELVSDPQPVILQLTKLQAWIVFMHLQLALRHPENTGPLSGVARQIALTLQELLATTPTLQRVAAMGWMEDLPDEIFHAVQ